MIFKGVKKSVRSVTQREDKTTTVTKAFLTHKNHEENSFENRRTQKL